MVAWMVDEERNDGASSQEFVGGSLVNKWKAVQKATLSVIRITVTCNRLIRAESAVNVHMMQFPILTMNVCLKTMQNDVLGYDV